VSGARTHPDQPADIGSKRRPARVLLVVGQAVLAEVVRMALSHGHFTIRIAQEWDDVSRLAAEWHPHLALLEMELGDGMFLDRIRGMASPIPVIALSQRSGLEAKLAAFERGVEDILTRPFSPEELVARALVAIRRIYHEEVAFTPVIQLNDLEIDILHRRARAGEHELRLTSVELSLLYLFAANAGRLLTRDEIWENLWGVEYAAESNLIEGHIRNLRAKLRDDWRRPRYIATVPKKGYRFLGGLPNSSHSPGR
jgi:DNA-binding response OmpR family regulator